MRASRRHDLAGNKLILLYSFKKLGLSSDIRTLEDLLSGRDWMSYFDMREHLLELCEAGFLRAEGAERFALTGEGLSALGCYQKRIPFSVRTRIAEYAREHADAIGRRTEIRADYAQESDIEFPASLTIAENGAEIFRMLLTAPSREEAQKLCDRFEAEAPALFADIVRRLTRDGN